MGLLGPKPEGKVKIKWSPNFAYAIGLIATDGNLSSTGRHILLTSKDKEQILNFLRALDIEVKIGRNLGSNNKKYFRVQFGDVLFYNFLQSIGITPAKSKTIGKISIPDKYFFHFLRGVFDGDGYSYSYWDKRWKSSFMFYIGFCSAGKNFIKWLQGKIYQELGINGHITRSKRSPCLQLKYAKSDSVKIIRKMYSAKNIMCLSRKRLKIKKMLDIVS